MGHKYSCGSSIASSSFIAFTNSIEDLIFQFQTLNLHFQLRIELIELLHPK